jgi:hypothetical protein
LLESDKQIVGPVSTQAPLDWRFGEWGDEFIGVYTDANIVMGAESADFFFDCWHLKVICRGFHKKNLHVYASSVKWTTASSLDSYFSAVSQS